MARRAWQAARAVIAVAAVTMALAACGSTDDPKPSSSMPVSGTATLEIGGRQVTVHVPASYDPARPAPLLVALHGYTSYGKQMEQYMGLTAESDRRGFVYAYPDGLVDSRGANFWNATDACCDFFHQQPDDSGYLSGLITTLEGTYRIDRARVYLIGHSNGGFMSFRMACEHADQVTAIVSLNAATWNDAARCRPSEPVSVLAIHGSADETIAFEGGLNNGVAYPSADATVTQWRGYDGCGADGRDGPKLDLIASLPGAETSVRTYSSGCAGGSTVQAWTMTGGSHVPQLTAAFAPAVTDFLLSQVKPAR
ncbi:esterase [Actinoplanes ianthinogenes]|uniref:Esterase n=1 Tax=Actinoplanes ianthinogenes TaxID=122358 RepID=A0ABM7M9P5_9ACTN|nr:alpha/beta fold hydrolase [Actinoplanes ianthinogenes]BCJ48323.1 esterase [Actinoplanes ianthinogenes]GGR47149.1 esterase [Actinoplanes ianthinogenes]